MSSGKSSMDEELSHSYLNRFSFVLLSRLALLFRSLYCCEKFIAWTSVIIIGCLILCTFFFGVHLTLSQWQQQFKKKKTELHNFVNFVIMLLLQLKKKFNSQDNRRSFTQYFQQTFVCRNARYWNYKFTYKIYEHQQLHILFSSSVQLFLFIIINVIHWIEMLLSVKH